MKNKDVRKYKIIADYYQRLYETEKSFRETHKRMKDQQDSLRFTTSEELFKDYIQKLNAYNSAESVA